jgi:hypothetical protein
MAELASLDQASESALQDLERRSGAWMLAYSPGELGEPPPYAARLTPATLDQGSLSQLQDLERRTGACIVAYERIEADRE